MRKRSRLARARSIGGRAAELPCGAAILALLLALWVPTARADEGSLAGEWWLAIRGRDAGAAALTLAEPAEGQVAVSGHGITLGLGERFELAPGQVMTLTSKSQLQGSLALEAADGSPLGSLEIRSGRLRRKGESLTLTGALSGAADSGRVRLRGRRMDPGGVLTGRGLEARMRGRAVRSETYEITVEEHPTASFPWLALGGYGPAEIDGIETSRVSLSGDLMLDPRGRIWGAFSSRELGSGGIKGRLRAGKAFARAQLRFLGARRVRLSARLQEAVSPRLAVVVLEGRDFGDLELGTASTLSFKVLNVGVDVLEGAATLTGSDEVTLSDADYLLGPNETAVVTASFAPTSAGTASARLVFSGGGGETLTLRGSGMELPVTRCEAPVPVPPLLAETLLGLAASFTATAMGFVVGQIDPGGFLSQLLLQEGDLVTAVNGTVLDDPDDVSSLFSFLRTAPELELSIARNGEESMIVCPLER